MAQDQMIYFVQVDLGRQGLVWLERSDTSRKDTINDIREGQIVDVTAILECNPVEHICRDVTEEIKHAAQYGEPHESPALRARLYEAAE